MRQGHSIEYLSEQDAIKAWNARPAEALADEVLKYFVKKNIHGVEAVSFSIVSTFPGLSASDNPYNNITIVLPDELAKQVKGK
jgi:hypothetical protein